MTPETPSSSGSDSSLRPSSEERLLVAVRIRPLETNEGPRVLHAYGPKDIILEDNDKKDVAYYPSRRPYEKQYSFDTVFGEESTQEEVYLATTRALVNDVLNGYNATVFAYGPTGSGKTHTMVGESDQPGIMVRALNDLFKVVRDKSDFYTVTISYLEVYNEQIRDLLNPQSGHLELREDSRGKNTQVPGLKQVSTTSTAEIMLLLQKGNRARTTEPTALNLTSSRSHALLSVTVRYSDPVRVLAKGHQGRLYMIDLAGSERATKTKNHGKRLQEGGHINRSLLALGNCINALSGGARFVNYRDSKLTRLLKDTLGGNCRTVMIAHVSPAARNREESRNTLIYAERASCITNKLERNVLDVSYHLTQYQTVINELQEEITRLRQKITLDQDRPKTGQQHRNNAEVRQIRDQIVDTFKAQMSLRRKLMEIDSQLLGIGMEAERQHLIISHWESRRNKLYKKNGTNEQRVLTQQSLRREPDENETTAGKMVQDAWNELSLLEKEQEQWAEKRASIEGKLETCRLKGVALEDRLPTLMSSDDEREILALICRVHELEADKMALQSERLVRHHELRRRDLQILRYDRQRHLADEIITKQRQLIEAGNLKISIELQDLYQMYQQEIQADSYTDTNPHSISNRLPSINRIYSDPPLFRRRGVLVSEDQDSEDSDDSIRPLPTVSDPSIDRIMGQAVSRFGTRLPQLSNRETSST